MPAGSKANLGGSCIYYKHFIKRCKAEITTNVYTLMRNNINEKQMCCRGCILQLEIQPHSQGLSSYRPLEQERGRWKLKLWIIINCYTVDPIDNIQSILESLVLFISALHLLIKCLLFFHWQLIH